MKKANNILSENFYCALPAPLLWKGLFYIIPLLTLIFIVLAGKLLFQIYNNKKKDKKIFDKKTKITALWSVVAFMSLMVYGIVGLDFGYYLLLFFSMASFVLIAFYIAEHYKLFKVKTWAWIAVAAVAVFFAIYFAICFVNVVSQDIAFEKGISAECLNSNWF